MSPDKKDRSRILLVDDQPRLVQSLQALLRINGYQVELAKSAAEALRHLQEQRFSLMLIDLHMPEFNGVRLQQLVKEKYHDIEVIVVSGDSTFRSVKDALRRGAFDFIRKPYQPEELLTTVHNALDRYWRRRQLQRTESSLRESERLHRFIVNKSPDFIYMLDTEGYITYVNDKAEALLGYKRGELVGEHFSKLIHPHNALEINNFFSERRASERSSKNVEMRILVNRENSQVHSLENHELVVELNAIGMYEEDDCGVRQFIGTLGCARDITARKRSEAQISYQAYHDLLTRLPNRVLFDDRISQALAHARRYQQQFALLFLDLDRFKLINDTLGHAMGDRALQQVSERILGCLREEDTLCRFGGDEFALLLPDVQTRENVAAVAEKILKAVRQPFRINDHELYLSLSIGIAMYPVAGETGETLLQSADIAMYHVKASGKDGYCFYSDNMNGSNSSFLSVERDMYQALENQQFEVFFQPKVDPNTQLIIGMEALLRWRHPEKGLIYPGDFLTIAEDSKLIVPIGDWVLKTVCEELQRWLQQGLPKLKVSINISPVQLEQEDFVRKFIRTLEDYQLSGDQFEVDITEQELSRSRRGAIDKLQTLRKFGVSIAIDDFGRGYSSLSYLKNFPVNTVKIDRAFVRDIEETDHDACIVDAIALMARGLNLHLVAAGVETQIQLNYLKNLGCNEVQGFLYGEPQSASDTRQMLESRPTDGPHFILPD